MIKLLGISLMLAGIVTSSSYAETYTCTYIQEKGPESAPRKFKVKELHLESMLSPENRHEEQPSAKLSFEGNEVTFYQDDFNKTSFSYGGPENYYAVDSYHLDTIYLSPNLLSNQEGTLTLQYTRYDELAYALEYDCR
jgi:hypothetical protein